MGEFEYIQKQLEEIKTLATLSAKNILTVGEAAIYMDYTEEHIRKMMGKRAIKSYRSKSGKVYFRKADLDNWMTAEEVRTQEEIEKEARSILKKKGRVA